VRAVRSLAGSPTGWTTQRLHPDGASRLSDGVVVETHLLARVLGMRLLRVDGVVLLSPARLVGPVPPQPVTREPAPPAPGVGYDLTEAARLLREADATLRSASNGAGPARD
jgi:hypothetical protein